MPARLPTQPVDLPAPKPGASCAGFCRAVTAGPAAVDEYLSAEQIEGMNAVGALVNGVEPIVPVELFDVVVAGVSVPTVDLDGQAVGLNRPLRGPTLGDGSQYLKQKPGVVAFGIGWCGECFVDEAAAIQAEPQCAFDVAFLGQQHSAYIGMGDDRDLVEGVVGMRQGSTLQPGAGIGQRL